MAIEIKNNNTPNQGSGDGNGEQKVNTPTPPVNNNTFFPVTSSSKISFFHMYSDCVLQSLRAYYSDLLVLF
jgi:hypothetical protein